MTTPPSSGADRPAALYANIRAQDPDEAPYLQLSPEGHDPTSLERVRIRGRLRRLGVSLFGCGTFVFIANGAIIGVLLPLQLQALDAANKERNLALAVVLGGLAALLAEPLVGYLSDRTRTRWGARAPWLIGTTVLMLAGLVGMALSPGLLLIVIAFTIFQLGSNAVQVPLTAILPDRVPRGVRGTFASMLGLAVMLGNVGGQGVGAAFSDSIPTGYLVLGVLAVAAMLLFVALNPDHSNAGRPRERIHPGDFFRTLWVNPRTYPDFAWGFLGRALLYLAFYLFTNYQLFILQDYIGLGGDAVRLLPVLGAITLVGILVGAAISGPLSDRMARRKPVVLVSGLFMATALAIPAVSPTWAGMIGFAILTGLGFGAFHSVDTALMSEVLPTTEDYGKDLGILGLASGIPTVIAGGLAGVVVVTLGYQSLLALAAAVAVLGALAVLPIRAVR